MPSVYKPPVVSMNTTGYTTMYVVNYFPAIVAVHHIEAMAGAAIGTAVISYPAKYASGIAVPPSVGGGTPFGVGSPIGMGCILSMNGRVIFRGVISDGPFSITTDTDELQLILSDDKWLMSRKTVGMPGIGSQPAVTPGQLGFNDVGFDVIFNKDGRPNKDPAAFDFITDTTAVYWTLKDIMQFLFQWYVDSGDVQLNSALLDTDYDRKPMHRNLVGMTALQAVDTIAQLAGQSWGLIPGASCSAFTPVKPGTGTLRIARLFQPKAGGRADAATTWHVKSGKASMSVQQCKDDYIAMSGPILKEHTYNSSGTNPLLVRNTAFVDPTKQHVAQFRVDVTQYAANNLGPSLPAGSRPKKWHSELVTRLTAAHDGYLTAADIAADPIKRSNDRIAKPFFWISLNGTNANAQLCTGGFRVNTEHGTIELKSHLDVWPAAGDQEQTIVVSDWTKVAIWLTIATIIQGIPKFSETNVGSLYLPKKFTQLIVKHDLIPEQRGVSVLPVMGGANNAVFQASTATEDYVDVGQQLDEIVAGAIAQTPSIESPLELDFPFMPELNIGDLMQVQGRQLNLSGNEVVTRIAWDIYEAYDVHVTATNVLAGVNPDQFLEAV